MSKSGVTILVCSKCGVNYDSTVRHKCQPSWPPGWTPEKVRELIKWGKVAWYLIEDDETREGFKKALAALEEKP